MPPFKNGVWTLPTDSDIQSFRKMLKPDTTKVVDLPQSTVQALVNTAEASAKMESSNLNFFKIISRIQGPADIVVPIYGGLHILKECIKSVLERTSWPYTIYLVDDASPDPEIRDWMHVVSKDNLNVQAIYNKKNRGFAATVNRGIQQGTNPYIVVLNSDVIVTQEWLTKILVAMEADPKNAIVNPLTNNTALTNVNMYPGKSYLDMDFTLNRIKNIRYPETMPTGFCLAIRRSVFNEMGPLDEAYGSYGEEALCLSTVIPTPKGPTTVESLTVGDKVFAIDGTIATVVKATEVFHNRECNKVILDSGIAIVADVGHNWTTTVGVKKTSNLRVGDRLPLSLPVAYPSKELLIDPYLFGVWLGDGHSHHARITTADAEIKQAFKDGGYRVTDYDELTFAVGSDNGTKSSIKGKGIYGSLSNPATFENKLKVIGVLHNKHIPDDYKYANVKQRVALLQGLMDTDGYCSDLGRCVLSTSNETLLNDYLELIRSLGLKASVTKPIKSNYRIHLRGSNKFELFRLNRKQSKIILPTRINAKTHKVVKIESAPSVPVKCIAIDHSSHTFLVDGYVPTHNTDFWFKTIRAKDENGVLKGYRAVLADNCYVFHERGTSFSQLGDTAHMKQRRSGSERFHKLHPDFGEWQKGYDVNDAVGHLRAMIPPAAFQRKYKGNIAWLVKSAAPCGGMNFIADIVNEMCEQGYNAKVCLIAESDPERQQHTVTSALRSAPVAFENPNSFVEDFGRLCFTEGLVLSAVTELSHVAKALSGSYAGITAMNHVQSWDIELAKLVNREEMIPHIETSYKSLPNVVSSKWVAEEIEKIGGTVTGVYVPGVNPDLFHPRDRSRGDERFTVGILMEDMYSYKGYKEGVDFCKKLKDAFDRSGTELRILAVAADSVPECPYVIGTGHLSSSAMAQTMANEIDVFVDPARLHSYGLPALEALFSGCGAVTFGNKGDQEYAHLFKNRIFVSKDLDECVNWILTYEPPKRQLVINQEDNRQNCVKKFIYGIFPKDKPKFNTRIEVITPHMRKHGGPTTIIQAANRLREFGHNVGLTMIYTDWNPEVINLAKSPIRTDWRTMPEDAKLVVINSDNPFAKEIMGRNIGRKYIMYKLSHNARFKQIENDNLDLPWDHIVTSTAWLREACLVPQEGWGHKAWPAEKVTVVGWYHYGHETFNMPPTNKVYGGAQNGFRIGTLIHDHPLKGTNDAMSAIEGLKRKYGANMQAVGLGETKARFPAHWQYIRSAPRQEFAHVMKQLDVWYGASHTEGLGRLNLEAMSAGVAVVTTNTGAEFLKHGENCLLYEIGNAQAGAELVDHLVSNQELFKTLVINGYNTAAAMSDHTNFVTAFQKVIEEVCNA